MKREEQIHEPVYQSTNFPAWKFRWDLPLPDLLIDVVQLLFGWFNEDKIALLKCYWIELRETDHYPKASDDSHVLCCFHVAAGNPANRQIGTTTLWVYTDSLRSLSTNQRNPLYHMLAERVRYVTPWPREEYSYFFALVLSSRTKHETIGLKRLWMHRVNNWPPLARNRAECMHWVHVLFIYFILLHIPIKR